MIHEMLGELGFSKKEAEVYIAVLQHKKISVTDLAKITGINRTTLYGIAKELLRKKVIREDVASSKSYLLARPPEDLHTLLEKEKTQLNRKEHAIGKAIGELQTLAKSEHYSMPKISFVDEEDIESYMYAESQKWTDSALKYDGVWWGFQDHTFVESYEKWIRWYWKTFDSDKVGLKMWSNQSQVEEVRMKKQQISRRQIRFWTGADPVNATTWVNGDYVVMIITNVRPHYLVEIHDPMLARTMVSMFRELWEKK